MKISALLGVFAVTVIVLAVAWAVCLNPNGDSLLPLGVGVLIGSGIQVFSWSSLSEFPEAYAKLLRFAFPLAATLIAVPLGLFVSGFFLNSLYPDPRQVDLGWALEYRWSLSGNRRWSWEWCCSLSASRSGKGGSAARRNGQ